jgi:CRP-like cAMP-binding protein
MLTCTLSPFRHPPPSGWMRRWFELTCDPLGRDLAPLCDWLRAATGRRGAAAVIQARARERRASSAARAAHASSPPVLPERAFAAAPPRPLPPPAVSPTHAPAPLASHEPSAVALTSEGVAGALASAAHRAVPASLSDAGFPPPTTGLAARVLLLRGSRLFRGVLTLHVAAVAQAAQQVTVTQGQRITKPGASYFVMEGKARREPEEVLSSRHPHRNTGMSGGAQPSVGAGDPSPVPFGSSSEPAFTRGSNATGSFSAGMCLFSGTSFSAPAEASAPPASPAHPPSLASPAHHPPSLAPPAHHPPSLAAPAALHGPPLREYVPGDAIQELGCFDHTLPVVRCVATCPSRCLVLPPGLLWRLILTLPPKFGLSLLRALVTFAPSASHGAAKLQQENSAQVADRQSQLVQPRGVQSRGAQSRMVQPGELRPPGVASQRAEMACGYIEGRGRGQAGGVAAGGAPAVGRGAAVGTGVASGGAQVCVAASEHGLAGRAALPELPEHVEGAEGAAPACGGEACSSVGEAGVREAPDAVYAQAAGANAQAAAVNADAESAAVSTAASHVCACEGEASEEEAEEEGEAGGGGEVVAAEVEGEGEGQAEGARIAFSRDERAWLLRQVGGQDKMTGREEGMRGGAGAWLLGRRGDTTICALYLFSCQATPPSPLTSPLCCSSHHPLLRHPPMFLFSSPRSSPSILACKCSYSPNPRIHLPLCSFFCLQVKLLRFVHRRFIPSLADIVSELRLSPGQHVCTQGDPTPGRLFIVAHGALQLWRSPAQSSPPVLLRELTAGDSLGNTGLIADGKWEYTAVASQGGLSRKETGSRAKRRMGSRAEKKTRALWW